MTSGKNQIDSFISQSDKANTTVPGTNSNAITRCSPMRVGLACDGLCVIVFDSLVPKAPQIVPEPAPINVGLHTVRAVAIPI